MRCILLVLVLGSCAASCRRAAAPDAAATRADVVVGAPAGASSIDVGPLGDADPAWQEVLAAARPSRPPGDHALLDRALAELAPVERELRDRFAAQRRFDDPARQAPLPDAARAAVDDLRAWRAAGGGIDTSSCDTANVLALQTLARAALAANASDNGNAKAAIYLAHALGSDGPTILHAMTGAAIVNEAVERWKTAPDGTRLRFADFGGSAGWLVHPVAAEGVCAVRRAGSVLGPEGADLRAVLARDYGLPTSADQAEFLRGEIEAVRGYVVAAVRTVRQHADDPAAAAAALDRLRDETLADPRAHPLVSLLTMPLGDRVRELAESAARYRAFVATAP